MASYEWSSQTPVVLLGQVSMEISSWRRLGLGFVSNFNILIKISYVTSIVV